MWIELTSLHLLFVHSLIDVIFIQIFQIENKNILNSLLFTTPTLKGKPKLQSWKPRALQRRLRAPERRRCGWPGRGSKPTARSGWSSWWRHSAPRPPFGRSNWTWRGGSWRRRGRNIRTGGRMWRSGRSRCRWKKRWATVVAWSTLWSRSNGYWGIWSYYKVIILYHIYMICIKMKVRWCKKHNL